MSSLSKKESKKSSKDHFRKRGLDTTRLDTFMDAAFAFATTMLVISVGELPQNYNELINALKEIPSFLCSFAILILFWSSHRTWSSRYGMEDALTVIISVGLIFVLLVYIYPLRLMFSALFAWISKGWLPSSFALNTTGELLGLFIIYGIGLMAMSLLLALLYERAYKARVYLELSNIEILKTHQAKLTYYIISLTGLLSALFAWLAPANINLMAGIFYTTLPISTTLVTLYFKKREKQLLLNH